MKYIFRYFLFLAGCMLMVLGSCGNNQGNPAAADTTGTGVSTAGKGINGSIANASFKYNLEQVEKTEMKKKLKEISGISFLKDNQFIAIQDESGKIFTLDYRDGAIKEELVFGDKGDYEDVTLDDKYFYVLESVGKIYRVPRSGDVSAMKIFEMPAYKHSEFESIYLDKSAENLVMICKNCPGKKNNLAKYAFAFNVKKEAFAEEPLFTIDLGTIPGMQNTQELDVKPSATAIHPIEKKLYILCSVGKMLLVCSLDGKIEQAFPLNPAVYRQPEGLAFTPNGDMFISNEAADGEKGNILKLVYKR